MKNLLEKLESISKVQIIALLLIVVGLAIMVPKAMGMFEFYKEARFASDNNFAAGNPSPDLLRPWMSIRYISVAYAVPQKYLFETIGVQPKKENSMLALARLNNEMKLGLTNGAPTLIGRVREAILAYRANPVVTGLIEGHVSDWMTVQYIANSTGIPSESIFKQINLPMDGNAYKPIGYLGSSLNYPGRSRQLIADLQKIVDSQGVQLVKPTELAQPTGTAKP